ncbi:MAG: glutamate racemase [Verrucomicrobia bacterium]|nr:MAG: glutamate racemase [Verrucomicrobiota bacterium]
MSNSHPIGVFDSGIGGLTVVKALRDLLPNEDICYLGDTARVPYGPKSPETVQRYAVELAGMLMRKNAKALVVACNTVSSIALPLLTREFSVPVIGVIEPGARAALQATRNRHIGVIGTQATIRSGAYEITRRRPDGPSDCALSRAPAFRWDRYVGARLHALSFARRSDHARAQAPNYPCRFRAKLCACSRRNAGSTITSRGATKPG